MISYFEACRQGNLTAMNIALKNGATIDAIDDAYYPSYLKYNCLTLSKTL